MKKKELIKFYGFPVKVGFYQGRSSSTYPPLYYHKEVEIQLFLSGQGRYYIRGKIYNFSKNTVLIIHGNEPHRYLPHPDSFIKRYNLIFTKDILSSIPSALKILEEMKKVYIVSLSDIDATECQHLMEEITQECKLQKEYWKECVLINIQKVLIILKRSLVEKKQIKTIENSTINKIILEIENNYSSNITLKTLSMNFGISPFYLSRNFKKYTGFGFKEYLIHTRIAEAKDLLLKEDLKVSAVAHRVGFMDISSFNKNFRNLTGYTPSAYRRLFKKSFPAKIDIVESKNSGYIK